MAEHAAWMCRARYLRAKAGHERDEVTRAQLLFFAEDCEDRAELERRKETGIRRWRQVG
jgi:hypothetical protein